ncbi:MAG TPA: SulP family inorganic anion transporter [Candidatus Dormibacteraeota bacterium]|nr:SulP family inorganic anion transporter [Candidatus Dormibacteraeota bacterium]
MSKAESQPQSSPDRRWRDYIPIFNLLRSYERRWLFSDVLAGVSVCLVTIPGVIAYTGLMGLQPQHGLYAALIPLLMYPLFGSSRHVIVGPDIAIALLVAAAIAPLSGGDPARAALLAAALALMTGFLLLLGALLKIGAVADFFSKPVLVGYMSGAAMILIASQLNKFFGVDLGHKDFFPRLLELGQKFPHVHWLTFSFGIGLLVVLLVLRKFAPKIPAAVVVCILAVVVAHGLNLEERGVKLLGTFPSGLPVFRFPMISWQHFEILLPAAAGIALLIYTEGILLARAFAAKNGYEVNANQELAALGLANFAAGCFQGFSVTGSQARTNVNDTSGGKTQVASLIAALTLGIFLLFFTGLVSKVPAVALSAILIYAGLTMVEFGVMKRIYRYYPRSSAIAGLTTLGVLAAGVVPGILLGVCLSLLGLINRVSHPPDAVLSEVPGRGFHDLGNHQLQTLPGLIAYRFYAPLLFCNSSHFLERARHLIASAPERVRWFLLDAQAITDIDVTAVETLHMLNVELREKGITLKIAHANPPLKAVLERVGFTEELSPHAFFSSVHECAEAFQKGS